MEWREKKGNITWPIIILIMFFICEVIGLFTENPEPDTCIRAGCYRDAEEGSIYCYLHKSSSSSSASSRGYCIESGCTNYKASGSSYCYTHKNPSSSSSVNNTNPSSTSSSYHTNTTTSDNSTHQTYNTPNCDPADYDTPEDYADDAWGDDFDDWDDAYDYWEDY